MAEIVMCIKTECPKKDQCYRFKATPFPIKQSYGAFLNCNKDTDYSDFWDITSDSPKNPKCKINNRFI